jgi:hypothetical protein
MTESTPRSDAMHYLQRLQGIAMQHDGLAEQAMAVIAADNIRAELTAANERATQAEARVKELEDVLIRKGFVRCDIAACNCGSWHHRYGLPERFAEIKEVLRNADVLNNETGNLPINAIRKLVEQRTQAEALAEVRGKALEAASDVISKLQPQLDMDAPADLAERIAADGIVAINAALSLSPSAALEQVREDALQSIEITEEMVTAGADALWHAPTIHGERMTIQEWKGTARAIIEAAIRALGGKG